jgi:hypothetical protein
MPFPIQRIKTDRGTEFTAYKVRDRLLEWGIKFRPVRPAPPHLNGKVERAQRTDLDELYSVIAMSNLSNRDLEELDLPLAELPAGNTITTGNEYTGQSARHP